MSGGGVAAKVVLCGTLLGSQWSGVRCVGFGRTHHVRRLVMDGSCEALTVQMWCAQWDREHVPQGFAHGMSLVSELDGVTS